MGSYVPNTPEERQQMLAAIGCETIEDLYGNIPEALKLHRALALPEGKAELEVRREMTALAGKNVVFPTIFRGAGAYHHYIPSIVKYITAKEEFVTAYTPYQAEISQGVLQSIFEYQTMVCELTGMDVSNASVYDGASAAAEAVAMCRERKRTKVLVSAAAHPDVIATIRTYCFGADAEVALVPAKDGVTDQSALAEALEDTTACFYLQQPNFFGQLEDAEAIGALVHQAGAKYIMGCNPVALAVIKTPAECGADIAVGEGQPLGLPLSYGGPYLGYMACTQKLLRKLPGRIVGETTDDQGRRVFVLTLQAREQHIRREKASSNVCSNQALCAMTASVFLSAMGPAGLREMAEQCMAKAHYAAAQISSLPGFALCHPGPFFHEFLTECPIDPEVLLAELEQHGILGGYPVDGKLLWCVTEMNQRSEIDQLVARLKEAGKK